MGKSFSFAIITLDTRQTARVWGRKRWQPPEHNSRCGWCFKHSRTIVSNQPLCYRKISKTTRDCKRTANCGVGNTWIQRLDKSERTIALHAKYGMLSTICTNNLWKIFPILPSLSYYLISVASAKIVQIWTRIHNGKQLTTKELQYNKLQSLPSGWQ